MEKEKEEINAEKTKGKETDREMREGKYLSQKLHRKR